MHGTPKRNKKMLNIFLIPLIGLVLLQGALLLALFFGSGVKDTMENTAVETATHILENRQMALQNVMVNEWGALSTQSEDCATVLDKLLNKKGVSIKKFLGDEELQEKYLEQIFPEMVSEIQQNTTAGGFVVLANQSDVTEASDCNGFFIRDSDPAVKTASNADLLMERGDKNLARSAGISLDNPWSQEFHFAGKGKRESDSFFYEPYLAGLSHPSARMINLGYWSTPFILEDSYMDNHSMMTYSMPLQYEGVIYGVLGIEVSVTNIEEYMDVRGLDANMNAGYVLAKKKDDNTYQSVAGKGILYENAARQGETFQVSRQSLRGLYQVDDVTVGEQNVYAVTSPLELYGNNVPYADTQWELCALVTENYIFETARSFYEGVIWIVVICALVGMVVIFVVARKVLRPVNRLMESVRGGVEGIREFVPSRITEIDELHHVVEQVTEAQKKTEDSLVEETERYRLAIESSQDIFFTYRGQEKNLEVVNTAHWDGIWDFETFEMDFMQLYPEDKVKVKEVFGEHPAKVELEIRMRLRTDAEHGLKDAEYEWYSLYASVIYDENHAISMVAGYLHNIHARKLLEQEEKRNKTKDPVTDFYTATEGFRQIREAGSRQPEGVLFVLRIQAFGHLNEKYGMIFGDILVEQLSEFLRNACEQENITDALLIRAGYSELAGWLPGLDEDRTERMLNRVREQLGQLVRDSVDAPRIVCGMTRIRDKKGSRTVIEQAITALQTAEQKQLEVLRYSDLTEKERQRQVPHFFEKVISVGDSKQMGLVSVALNLFDRGGSTSVLLDLLVARIKTRYPLKNLLITTYNKENMVNSLEYSRERRPEEEQFVPCREQDVAGLMDVDPDNMLHMIEDPMYQKPMFQKFVDGAHGIAVNMTDNGHYSGTIFFEGLSAKLLLDEEKRKELRELATVIQNRINQEKHDLSAQAKADFLARMSHEIRTPMNGIIGMTEIALKDGQTEEKKEDCLQKIRGSSQYLLSLVNDILDMSKIDSGKMQITESRVDFRKKLCGLYDLTEAKITEKNIHYTENIDLVHSWFWVDELRVTQVLINILGNAVKYTDAGGHIYFEAVEKPLDGNVSEIHFAVTDDGVGISAQDQQLVFQSFEQARYQNGVYRQGTGLGLAISNRLVHLMGSSIQLESEPGRGSTFAFTLRLKWFEAEDVAETVEDREIDLKGRRILVVEDNELNREIITTILEDYGVRVEVAADGQIAVDMVRQSAPWYYDLILMDIMMPNMNGLEATREIRRMSREDSQTIPIIAMTANAFAEEQKQSLASGMNAHLTKPLDIEKLRKTLKEYLSDRW